jgi:hypothetical protein
MTQSWRRWGSKPTPAASLKWRTLRSSLSVLTYPSSRCCLFALVRRQIIGTMLSRLLLADGWRCQFALFDGRGRPLVPLGLEVGEIMDRLMEDPESSSDQLAIHFRQPGQDRADIVVLRCEYTGPAWTVLSLDPACYGALAPIAAQALQFPAWMRQGGSVAPADHLWPDLTHEVA